MKNYSYNAISRFRNELFGIAIIMIIIFHYMEDVLNLKGGYYRSIEIASRLWNKSVGSVGVEIFVFLSAMGLYYSMSKNADIGLFYKKRLSRILFPYFIVGGVFWIYTDLIVKKLSLIDFLNDYLFVTFVTKGVRTFWYIGFILVIYAVFPWIYRMVRDHNERVFTRKIFILTVLVMVMSLGFEVLNPMMFKNVEVAIERLLAFNLGLLLAPAIQKGKKVKWYQPAGLFMGMLICIVLKRTESFHEFFYAVMRWRNSFLSVIIILIFAFLLQYLSKISLLEHILCWFGKYTLEIYLLHVMLRKVFKMNHLNTAYLQNYVMMIACSLALTPILAWMNSKVVHKIMNEI